MNVEELIFRDSVGVVRPDREESREPVGSEMVVQAIGVIFEICRHAWLLILYQTGNQL